MQPSALQSAGLVGGARSPPEPENAVILFTLVFFPQRPEGNTPLSGFHGCQSPQRDPLRVACIFSQHFPFLCHWYQSPWSGHQWRFTGRLHMVSFSALRAAAFDSGQVLGCDFYDSYCLSFFFLLCSSWRRRLALPGLSRLLFHFFLTLSWNCIPKDYPRCFVIGTLALKLYGVLQSSCCFRQGCITPFQDFAVGPSLPFSSVSLLVILVWI